MSPVARIAWAVALACLLAGPSSVRAADKGGDAEDASPVFHAGAALANEAAAKDGGLVLLVFEARWAEPCRLLGEKVLESSDFAKHGGALHVVRVDIDADRQTPRTFQVTAVPDLLLTDTDGKIIARTQGYLPVEEFMAWLERGRGLASRGLWQGTVPERAVDEKDAGDPSRLAVLLGSADQAERAGAAEMLIARRAAAVPLLVDLLGNSYLGVRIGAADVLRTMAPKSPPFDPWAPQAERKGQAAEILSWWRAGGEIVDSPTRYTAGPEQQRHIDLALRDLEADDPVRRTEAMARLFWFGDPALASVREAIDRAAAAGDTRTVQLLEDVRWAILIPEAVESDNRLRAPLSRGNSDDRQAATQRLGGAGHAALPALRELTGDADPLVKECAVLALKQVGGEWAVAATAMLLKSKDSNLRMVAAQALGESKSHGAATHLAEAVRDPDEVVACVAIAALEEIKAKDQSQVLIECLSDPRWRVRAAAAEVLGKLEVSEAAPALKQLLNDADAFVSKTAMVALGRIRNRPTDEQLLALVARQPDLTGTAVELLLDGSRKTALKSIEKVYDQTTSQGRQAVMAALAEDRNYDESDDSDWRPLLEKAFGSDDVLLRQQLVPVLMNRSTRLTCDFITLLLEDADPGVRTATASLVLRAAANHWDAGTNYYAPPPRGNRDRGLLLRLETGKLGEKAGDTAKDDEGTDEDDEDEADDEQGKAASPEDKARKLAERAAELRALHDRWHELLSKDIDPRSDFRVLLACYVTGDAKADLPLLERVVASPDLAAAVKDDEYGTRNIVALLVRRLPWPEGRHAAEQLVRSPRLYAAVLSVSLKADSGLRDFLCDGERMAVALDAATDGEGMAMAEVLLEDPDDSPASLVPSNSRNETIVKNLAWSENALGRAVGIYVLAERHDDDSLLALRTALADSNPWVRYAAAQSIRLRVADQADREKTLGPLLNDSEEAVVFVTAVSLLDDALCKALELDDAVRHFRFGSTRAYTYRGSSYDDDDDEIPVGKIFERRPSFLDVVRQRLADAAAAKEGTQTKDSEEFQTRDVLALLAAQYGDFQELEAVLDRWQKKPTLSSAKVLLAGLALTRDARYLPVLAWKVKNLESPWEARGLLKWLRGVSGSEARELRREINRKIRSEEN